LPRSSCVTHTQAHSMLPTLSKTGLFLDGAVVRWRLISGMGVGVNAAARGAA
jgi:hypothetical protein